MKRKIVLIAALVVALGATSAGIAIAAGVGGDEKPLTGSALDQATAAALKHAGGGTVVETEVGDDGAAYGVEIRRADGSQVEVSLDANFNVIGDAADDDGANEQNEQNGQDDD
jgi:peptidase YpeB-like protein